VSQPGEGTRFVGCTAVTVSHLPRARVAAESWRQHHPESPFYVLLVDGDDRPVADEPFETVRAAELGLAPEELAVQQGIYDAYELSCALRPHVIRLLLERDAEAVVFTDSDTRFYAPADDLARAAAGAGLVLLPTATQPVTLRRYFPASQIEYRQWMNGLFNCGLLAVGQDGRDFVDWWADWLARDCLREPSAGLWVDQLWLDWAPVYFEHLIMRDKSLNVAFWNLDERETHELDGRPAVDGAPLRHFHFAGFDPHRPELLSTYYTELAGLYEQVYDRELPPRPSNPVLDDLLRRYAQDLLRSGSDELRERPYDYAVSAAGRPLERRERAIYREAVLAAEARGTELPPSPFDPSRSEDFDRLIDDPASLRSLSPRAQKRLELVRPPGLSVSSLARVGGRLAAAARYALTEQPPPDLEIHGRTPSDTVRLEY
jgi:hypothetical protein